MAKSPESYDVWLVAPDTVYRGVPFGVVTDWALQGRMTGDDRVRPAGYNVAWLRAADHPLVKEYLSRRTAAPPPGEIDDAAEQFKPVELDVEYRRKREDEDDDVDMIPLIDISLVLLIFFMMTTAVASLSPVNVPEMQHASKLEGDSNAFQVVIDKRGNNEVFFELRIGKQGPKPEDTNLSTPEEVLRRLDARLAEVQAPPEVLILCHRDLERGWVRDIARELEKRKQKNQIAFYGAEVNERAK